MLKLSRVLAPALISSLSLTSLAGAAVIERLEASVNSDLILLSDIAAFRERIELRAQLDPLFAGTAVAAKGASASNDEITEFLIDEKLIAQTFPVSDTEVEQEINTILANNRIDRETLKSTLRAQGFTYEQYFELIRASASKRNLIDRDIRTKVTISDDDVRNYYYNHYARGTSAPRTYRLRLLNIAAKNYKSPSAARQEAERALQRIRSGEAFDEVAKSLRVDPLTNQGDLITLSENELSPVLQGAVKGLQKGQSSEVISQGSSLLIVHVEDILTGEDARFTRVREEIRAQLVAAEYQHLIQLWLQRQRQQAFIHRAP